MYEQSQRDGGSAEIRHDVPQIHKDTNQKPEVARNRVQSNTDTHRNQFSDHIQQDDSHQQLNRVLNNDNSLVNIQTSNNDEIYLNNGYNRTPRNQQRVAAAY